MGIKRKAIEVTFTDGSKHMVHEPSMRDLGVFLQAMPALSKLGEAMENFKKRTEGIKGLPVGIDPDLIDELSPLFGVMADMTAEEFADLGVFDGMGVLNAFTEFAPKAEPTQGKNHKQSSPQSTPTRTG